MRTVLLCGVLLVKWVTALPISQPVLQSPYVNAQQVQAIQFVPRLAAQPQIQYVQQQQQALQQSDSGEIYGGLSHRPSSPPPPPPPPPSPPAQIQQLLLPSAVDRQVQQAAAYVAGPHYAQQVQNVQLQGLANQAQDIAQRRAHLTALRLRQFQPQLAQQQTQAKLLDNRPQPQEVQAQPQAPEDYDPNPSYQFGFDVKDDYYTNYQNRKEQRDGNKISGSYSVVDADGFLRTVTYTADPKEGFKAEVNRQPTNIVVKFPKPLQAQPKQQYLQENEPQYGGQNPRLIYQQYQQ